MRYKISFLLLVFVFILASCTKETPNITRSNIVSERSTILQLEVAKVSAVEDSGLLSVDFTTVHDFTDAVLEPTQYLNFEDASGNPSTLIFQVYSFTCSNGALQAVFTVGGNDLAGLSLREAQEIIIEDDSME